MLGLELRDSSVLAVAVDDDGGVRARAEVALGGKTLADAACEAIERVGNPSGPPATLGVASHAPESPACQAAVHVLAGRYVGPFIQTGADSSGTAAAVAESWLGAARGVQDAVFLAVSDHADAGIIRRGEPATGARRRAPAIAWLALNPVEREDYRKIGCLEAEVATAGIVRRLVWRIKAGDRSLAQDAANGDLSKIRAEHVLAAARDGDGVAISVMRDTAKYLGMAGANLVLLIDPQMLVLGGIMASAADLLMEAIRSEIARRLPSAMMDALAIVPAALGDDAAAIGAARLAAAART
ncbi:MAG TPA: ROK family protein [Gemmatimonadaceae bacterium]